MLFIQLLSSLRCEWYVLKLASCSYQVGRERTECTAPAQYQIFIHRGRTEGIFADLCHSHSPILHTPPLATFFAPTLTSRSYLAFIPNQPQFLFFFDNFFSFKDSTHNPTLPLSDAEPLIPFLSFLNPETPGSKGSPPDSRAVSTFCRNLIYFWMMVHVISLFNVFSTPHGIGSWNDSARPSFHN